MIEKEKRKRMERVTSAKRGNNRKRKGKGYRFSDRKRGKETEVKREIKGKKRE